MSRTAMPSAMVAPPTVIGCAGQALRQGGVGLDLDADRPRCRAHGARRPGAAGDQAAAAGRRSTSASRSGTSSSISSAMVPWPAITAGSS